MGNKFLCLLLTVFIKYLIVFFHVYIFSNARENVLKDAVTQLIKEKPICFRDMMLTKFTDPILVEHVNSVSIGDTEIFIKDKQVLMISEKVLITSTLYGGYVIVDICPSVSLFVGLLVYLFVCL